MALDGKSISPMEYVTLGTKTHHVTWSHVALGTVSVDHIFPHKILKTHGILIIFLYFMGNYVACKNYAKKEPSGFKNFRSTHF